MGFYSRQRMKRAEAAYIESEVIGVYYQKKELFWAGLVSILLGCGLHFLYTWFPGAMTALFSPVNESLWEHVKLIYWPYLPAAFWLNRGRPGGVRPWLLALPLMCGGMLLLGWLYHIRLGGEAMWVDIAIYVLVMLLGFWLPTRFSGPFQGVGWLAPGAAVIALGVLIGCFTLWPPDHILFLDLSSAGAWSQIPF